MEEHDIFSKSEETKKRRQKHRLRLKKHQLNEFTKIAYLSLAANLAGSASNLALHFEQQKATVLP